MLKNVAERTYFFDFLTVKLASVVTKVKPSCLLVFSDIHRVEGKSMFYLWNTYHKEAMVHFGLSFFLLFGSEKRKVILFYDLEKLSQTLSVPARNKYLSKLGYKPESDVYGKLLELKSRFREHSCPDEVGLFLGYPLKDVKGFMKKGALPLTCRDRWQIFGDASKSLYLISLHKIIEETFSKFLRNREDPMKHVEKIRNYCLRVVAVH